MDTRPSDDALADAADDIADYVDTVAAAIRLRAAVFRSRPPPERLLSDEDLTEWRQQDRIAFADGVVALVHMAETARARMDPVEVEMRRRSHPEATPWWRRLLRWLG